MTPSQLIRIIECVKFCAIDMAARLLGALIVFVSFAPAFMTNFIITLQIINNHTTTLAQPNPPTGPTSRLPAANEQAILCKTNEANELANIPTLTFHPEYDRMRDELKAVRTAVLGSSFVKEQKYEYLPHPSQIDTTSAGAVERYNQYLAGAEFDEFPKATLRGWLGKMKFDSAEIDLPDRLSYLKESIDNDGTSIYGAIEAAASNCLQVKWHVLVADYQGLSGVDISQVSKADIAAIRPRATIKQYNRESVVWWDFQRRNDAMQLTYIMLREESIEVNPRTYTYQKVESFLVLALDEGGNYYQQKIVKNGTGAGYEEGEAVPVIVSGKPLKWLPVEIVCDSEMTPGKMPIDLGYLSPICDLAYARYRTSADYKEAMRMIPPTAIVSGFNSQNWELFQQMNGRDYIAVGPEGNKLPEGATMEIVSASMAIEFYERYFKDNESKVRALGGVFPTDNAQDRTATEASINASDQASRLVTLASQLESAFTRAVLYCGMFEGLWTQDAIEQNAEQVVIRLNKEFAQQRMTPEEIKSTLEVYLAGLIPQEEAIKILAQGGITVSSADELIAQADGGDLTAQQ